jgi:hypothetical protein
MSTNAIENEVDTREIKFDLPPATEALIPDIYEVTVSDLAAVNTSFRNNDTGRDEESVRGRWTFTVVSGVDTGPLNAGKSITYWTGLRIGKSEKNKFTQLLKIVWPGFDFREGAYPADFDSLYAGVRGRRLRVKTDEQPRKDDPLAFRTVVEAVMKSGIKATPPADELVSEPIPF